MFGLALGWLTGVTGGSRRTQKLTNAFPCAKKPYRCRALPLSSTLGYYIIILVRAVNNTIALGSRRFAASFARSRDLISRLLFGASDIYQQCLYLRLFDFF